MTPREIVQELDRHIVGQHAAKRAVAIALRNRWRRMQLEPELRDEVMPKNILMIGPTGVGKTEIARRLATLANAPFVKVEATRFTEVGYVGKDVEQIIRDLADTAVKLYREQAKAARAHARPRSAPRTASSTRCCRARPAPCSASTPRPQGRAVAQHRRSDDTRAKLRKQLRSGALDEREIEIETRGQRRRRHHGAAGHGGDGPAAAADVLAGRRRQDPQAHADDPAPRARC